MIFAIVLAAILGGSPEETAIPGDCSADAATLREEARSALGSAGAPAGESVARARELLRRARRFSASAALSLDSADLAFAAGDAEEGGDLLAQAHETNPSLLGPSDLLWLARRAEDRRRWNDAISRYGELSEALAARGEAIEWIGPRLRELQVRVEADSLAPPAAGAPAASQRAVAEAKEDLTRGKLREAREKLEAALEEAPSYGEALLALGAVETRAGRPEAAVRAYRQALAAEPERFEALTALANVLWEEPDRRAKQESLALLEHAAAARPDERSLDRLLAVRWASFGDAARALRRLDRFRERGSARERQETEALRESLARQVDAAHEPAPPASEPAADEPTSAAVDRFRRAQVYFDRGDPDSLAAAATLAAEAEALDPSLPRIPELAAAIAEKRGHAREAEDALRRAIRADPSRASSRESLARLLERDPKRAREARAAWLEAADAGSAEALFQVARAAAEDGRSSQAAALYRRYLAQAPAGLRAADAARAAEMLDAGRRRRDALFGAIGLVLAAAAAVAIRRRRSGLTFAQWLARDPARAADARPLVGRLRHEMLKHGGLLLSDGAARLEESDEAGRRATAELLVARLYGESGGRGLVAETEDVMAALRAMARERGARLNLRHRDPVFSWVVRGIGSLRRAERPLRRLARPGPVPRKSAGRAARHLRGAARRFAFASGTELERAVDRVAALPVRVDALQALLSRVAEEKRREEPRLERLGAIEETDRLPCVRMTAIDWETVWRNLFANALDAASARAPESPRLALAADMRRDPVTGEARLRLVLADDLPGLAPGRIVASSPGKGLGVVEELVRRHGGSVEVTAPPAPGFTKGIALDLPAVEETV